MAETTDNLSFDTRLLSNAIIELNISRHNVAVYPQDHPIVEKSLNLVFAHLKKLFELRREITLAIAKDTLIIDDFSLDKKHPVYREFALCLNRMNIASLTFTAGLTKDEIYSFHSFLLENTQNHSPEDVQKSFEEYKIRYIKVEFIDYSAFNMIEGKKEQEGSDIPLWEKYVFGLLEGSLTTGDTPDVIRGISPEKLAALLNRANMDNAKEESYDKVITSYVRSSSEKAFSEKELKKLMDFINDLRPELKRQFLSSSVNVISSDLDSVKKSLNDMSVDDVIDLLSIINEQTVAIPKALKNVLDKFSTLHADSFTAPTYGGGLVEHDIVLSPEITSLLEDANFKAYVTDSYQGEIQRLLKFDAKKIANEKIKEFEKEWS
ncbi:MAG: hypothetical protein KAJ10_16175, partial [Thermodesulfovibrionia bacterium]|nr:hypothetical protein [Thermodesulfovibrionia bacterium]